MNKIFLLLPIALVTSCISIPKRDPIALKFENECIIDTENSDFEKAVTSCSLCLEHDEKAVECMNGQALIANAFGDTDAAKGILGKVLEIDPEFAKAYNNLGVIFYKEGDFDTGQRNLEKAVSLEPSYVQARLALTVVYFMQATKARHTANALDFLEKAKEQAIKVLEIDPSNEKAKDMIEVLNKYIDGLRS